MKLILVVLFLFSGCGKDSSHERTGNDRRSPQQTGDCLEEKLGLRVRPVRNRDEIIRRILTADITSCEATDKEIEKYSQQIQTMESL